MARMVDLIREGEVPASMMRRAAQGGLSLPAREAIEILVALAGHCELGEAAEKTLESWNETSLIEVARDALTPAEVRLKLLKIHGHRPAVVAALCENPKLALMELEDTASRAPAEVLRAMMQSARVRSSIRLLELMKANPAIEPVRMLLEQSQQIAQTGEADGFAARFLAEHGDEIAKVDGQRFELVAAAEGEEDPLEKLLTRAREDDTTSAKPEEREILSLLQRIGRMRVGERIKLAMRGNREERMLLIRDRSKLVSLAVLESPKVTAQEMEGFASMKNIQEAVLRAISTKRNYIKNYTVVRALVNNPKAPLDVTLPLLPHLLVQDVQALSRDKNVNETMRKMALKTYKMKMERKKAD